MAKDFATSADELRRLLGDVDDATIAAIFALQPSPKEVEEAVVRLDGYGYLSGNTERPLVGKIGAIYDLLAAEYQEEPPPMPTLH